MFEITEIRFDGITMELVDHNGNVRSSFTAVSGVPGYQSPVHQSAVDLGPIPEGEFYINTSQIETRLSISDPNNLGWTPGWGNNRVTIHPAEGNDIAGRDGGFFIHGSIDPLNGYGSIGCIDL